MGPQPIGGPIILPRRFTLGWSVFFRQLILHCTSINTAHKPHNVQSKFGTLLFLCFALSLSARFTMCTSIPPQAMLRRGKGNDSASGFRITVHVLTKQCFEFDKIEKIQTTITKNGGYCPYPKRKKPVFVCMFTHPAGALDLAYL